ncbi:ATP-dependent RNA helicase Prp16 [Schizosaccharomyces japonicus yFS275]|uniref:Pre-mRNA-splicing factor ATP-dependent RNA helicase PRP16 n=1 Tax=Schizosaccharomyces japonicus (strain yFS275 / FY16936) TaxID=402676 RepID=B6JZW3_SCHJY|nr:ATP-dependent RNA helicase Prp16 [Schizosaccharomyces japonicus yFS275]EEB06113.1 ATP-dependent RNA helicase Prp16 [Schizosaccharomyces japonicus yFS275]
MSSSFHKIIEKLSASSVDPKLAPNLAERVVAIAQKSPNQTVFSTLIRSFGRFDDTVSADIYELAKSESASSKSSGSVTPVTSNADVLENKPVYQKAGLIIPPNASKTLATRPESLGLQSLARQKKASSSPVRHSLSSDENGYSNKRSHGGTTSIDPNTERVEFKKPKPAPDHHSSVQNPRTANALPVGHGLSEKAREKYETYREQRRRMDEGVSWENGSRHDRTNSRASSARPSRFNRSTRNRYPPTRHSGYWDERAVEYPEEDTEPPRDRARWEMEQSRLDRDWYMNSETNNLFGDESHNPFAEFETDLDREREDLLRLQQKKKMSMRSVERARENNLWETNRMVTSGITKLSDVSMELDTNEERRVHLLVHELRPHFLDGQEFTLQQQNTITAVRDPQSDLAVVSKKGSALVRERREFKERQKAATAATALAGTALGNVMGVREKEPSENMEKHMKKTPEPSRARKNHDDLPSKKELPIARVKSLREQRELLPAFAVREQLLSIIRDNQVTVVVGETGSGKTTQLAQFLYEDGQGKLGMIGCTQPRRVAAMSVAKRVSEEMGVQLGTLVGYSIRFEDVTSPQTIIKYMTDGVLLRESLVQNDLDRYSVIIMDEAHERSLNTDILMGLLRTILSRRRDLKLIVTSATMNAQRFSEFFGGAPQFTIPGRTYPVDVLFSKAPCSDYVEAAVRQVLQIHVSQPAGDILVFMTGQEDIEVTCDVIKERLAQLTDAAPLSVLPIYSQMPADLQTKIFDAAEPGVRKVVVATNIAETSLTVDGISYVVDTGFCKLKMYNAKMGIDTLQITPISQANANQRSGRAGRTGPGVAYRLYTESAFVREMFQTTLPEIQRTNLSNTVLLLKSLGVKNIMDFDFMDRPPAATLTTSSYELWTLGALDNFGNLTALGSKMANFPMDPSLAKLLIIAAEYGCSNEVLTIVSMLSVPSVFYRPKERLEESDAAREKFHVPESDHLTLLNIYLQWERNHCSVAWCTKHFLHSRSLSRARSIRDQLLDIMKFQKLPIVSCKSDWDVIRKVLCSAYFNQAATAKGIGEYVHLRTGMPCHLHATSSLYGLGYLPDYVIYHELVLTSKEYMNVVTSVDPYWLAEFGGAFYTLKERVKKGSKIVDTVYSKKTELEDQIENDRLKEEEEKERARLQVKAKPRSRVVRAKPARRIHGF